VNKIHRKHKYEVLINPDRAARLEWRSYNKFAGVPIGAVAAVDENSEPSAGDNNVFIGRHLGKSGSWRPGAVEVPRRSSYSSFGVMRVFDAAGSVKGPVLPEEHSSGDILVEVEPVRYELDIHDTSNDKMLKNRPKTTKEKKQLTKSSLFRFDEGRDAEARLQKVLSYAYDKSEYYGQISGMIRALPTTIRLSNGETQSVLWGLPEKSTQRETMMVGHKLKHHTAVDVSIVADKITVESPYRATLTSIFPDGTRRQRKNVEGVMQRKYLNNISADYSRVYEINDKTQNENDNENMKMKNNGNNYKRYTKDNVRYSSDNGLKTTRNQNNNGNYMVQDWKDNDNYERNMLSDQMTQKSSTIKTSEEKQHELPLISNTHSNSSAKLSSSVSNFTCFVYLVTLFSTVLSVHLSKNYSCSLYYKVAG
jgi:hypothetical protein